MESQSETTQTVSALKLPVLKTRDYDLWSMRMEQYLTHTDYALWEVIVNGDAPAIASASTGTEESKMQRPYGKQSRLGLEATKNKKMQKTILKQQYKNFVASRSEGLDKTYDRDESQMAGGHAYYEGEKILKEDMKESEFQCKELLAFDKTNVECTTATVYYHFVLRECRAPRNQGNRNRDVLRRVVPVETPTNALVVQDGIGSSSSDSKVHTYSKDCLKSYEALQKQCDQHREDLNKSNIEIIGYQMGLESLEARIVVHEKNKVVYEEDITFLKYDVQVKDISIKDFKNQLEEALKEKDDLKLKLEKFEDSSKNLTKLINSQISVKDKDGLGYDSQMNESKVVYSMFNSRESDMDDSLVNDRFKTGEGFHAVHPPYTRNYMPSRPDLSFAGLDDSVYKTKVSETKTSISKTSKDIVEKPKTVRPSTPIIEDWDTDNDNDSVFTPKSH
ncbi:hypothetical protein Tco_1202947 [Tanacetum coccineum]